MSEEYVRTTQGVFQFELSGDEGGTWYIDLKTKGGSAGFGKPPVAADVVMSMSSADFVKMFTGFQEWKGEVCSIQFNINYILEPEDRMSIACMMEE
ncbi:hydroxysteroid dehydrogenase-like protein 2 isoform X2 [Tyto alba]|uniref:hydroxysteroid dehydrogenase-like protein 2 isoform X2 n=1 Tax=Tyto alba TaxID=56313 RepID=UPI001C6732F2|nr:hydroxysteroid dehydrogenase-like protein 2 isoform X2 [Tyto alba]